MKVRCGRCREPMDVAGPGRHACPKCGSMNSVGGPPSAQPEVMETVPDAEPSTPHSDAPTRTECPMCAFLFFVGEVAVAPCPNCRHEVVLRSEAEEAERDV